MAYQGFGITSGPTFRPNSSQPTFGGPFARPPSGSPSPPPPSSPPTPASPYVVPPQRSPARKVEAPERMRSPPLALQNFHSVAGLPYSSAATYRPSDPRWYNEQKGPMNYNNAQTLQRPSARTQFSASPNFGPSVPSKIPQAQDLKRIRSPGKNSGNISQDVNGRPSDPRWDNEQKGPMNFNNAQTLQRPSALTQFSALRNFGPNVPSKIPQALDLKRTRSPGNNSGNISQDVNGSRFNSVDDRSILVAQRTRSPPLGNNHTVEVPHPPFGEIQRPLSSHAWVSRPRSPCDYSDLLTSQDLSSVSPFGDPYESQRKIRTEHADVQLLKQTRSPPLPSSANNVHKENSHIARNAIKRPSMSPPTSITGSNSQSHTPGSEIRQSFLPSMHNGDAEAADTKPTSFPASKRSRSPPVPSADQVFQGISNSAQDETERESQAKAKRLARFKVELSQPAPSSSDIVNQKFTRNSYDPSVEKQKSVSELPMETAGDFPSGNALPEYEGQESSSVIIGLCPDMCPGPERAERERKGDLDQYERLDGDRNQTSKSLAVKKYNRTAEREADLIRPMPILQKTIKYLLKLLDQPYDERFLGMYNFLWDRMRAIRMDLRMQHIFNLGAIAMLEQMIRLHIIAMHELCEYTKGEGFSEGFDAHLNIEQMNKTSVELFQMYDDHRKKGINVPTEKEFRGYYALLKLDKHPGYKVEPAELSLDLAKMTPEIRQTPEVLFARDVARACRTGNFIAFFRLARRASYLQACLMHAHFAKLRTQALASLHSGLQNNQGLPIATVSKWLGMEEEDIESLSEYHGFLLKEFEEPYMVKEGLFLNSEKDYPTNCSKLVHQKRSRSISEDVSSSCQVVLLPAEEDRKLQFSKVKVFKDDSPAVQIVEAASPTFVSDEDMADSLAVSSPKDDKRVQPLFTPSFIDQQSGDDYRMSSVVFPSWNIFPAHISSQSQPAKAGRVEKQNAATIFERPLDRSFYSDTKAMPSLMSPGRIMQQLSPDSKFDFGTENIVPQKFAVKDLESRESADIHQESEPDKAIECRHEKETAEAKLKLILRIWRRRSSKLKELREQRLLAANAALNSLSLGPPIRQNIDEPSTYGEFNIDRVMRERYEKRGRSWSRLNVSDVVMDQLSKRNPETRCLCFKLIVCSQMNNADGDNLVHRSEAPHMAASSWLHSKLMPATKDDADYDLVKSLPGLSIWKKWIPGQSSTDLTCCLSVIKDVKFDDLNETVLGASAVLFLVSESISWDLQMTRLQNLLMSLPSNSCLPLLILSDSYNADMTSATIIDKLGLSDFDKCRISGLLVGDLQMGPSDGFFSDERLREGLQWLASESPLQPVLNLVKTREIIMTHLNSSLDMFDEMSVYEVAPDHCISAFNEALHRSLLEVAEAASSNPSNWPCPEITFLDDSSAEYRASKLYLPSIGWSSAATIEPLACALRECKLPAFSDDISWLGRGSSMGEEIENQRSQLENCLIRYLTESSKMMSSMLATNEARVMLQKNARLELHNSSFYIVPQWVMIFRRIFHWRLMNLSSGDLSSAYVFGRQSGITATSGGLDNLKPEISVSSPYHLMYPSLDEMLEVGCSPLLSRRVFPEHEERRYAPKMVSNPDETSKATNTSQLMANERNLRQDEGLATADDGLYSSSGLSTSSESTMATTAKTEADKLSKLLENCNILQNIIDKKLSVYF